MERAAPGQLCTAFQNQSSTSDSQRCGRGGQDGAALKSVACFDTRRANLHYLDEGATLLYAAGNYLHFIDLATMKQTYLPSIGGRGIGAVAVHPSKQYICVAEVGGEGAPPSAFLYEYPSLRLYRVLRHGTERAYTAVCFNVAGDKVASVGAFPDFMLTVWNWQQGMLTRTPRGLRTVPTGRAYRPPAHRTYPGRAGQLTPGPPGTVRTAYRVPCHPRRCAG